MFIPIRTDRPTRRRPIVTEALILLNVAVFLGGLAGEYFGLFSDRSELAQLGWLDPHHLQPWHLLTYQFLHDPHGYAHIIFNMLFLWAFGTAVEDRLGRWWFLLFYLAGGAFAGMAHLWTSDAPVIGASGSVAAVSGAFLALFPRAKIQVLVIFFIIGVYAVPATLFLGLFFAIDLLRATGAIFGSHGSVAFMAHIGGYVYGFGLAFLLLGIGVLKRTELDAFYLFRQSRRRAAFRKAQRQSHGGLWDAPTADRAAEAPRPVSADRPVSTKREQHLTRRARIQQLIDEHQLDAAADAYVKFMHDEPDAVLSQQHQTDIASTLYAAGDYANAARAYELLLDHYDRIGRLSQVRLLLGTILVRQLGQPQRARRLIEQARPGLSSATERDLADQLLSELDE